MEGATHFVLTARRADRLEELKIRLKANPAIRVDTLPADLGDAHAVTGLIAEMEKLGFAPDVLINNAGFGDLGTFETSDPAKIESMLAVNIVALTRLTRWAPPRHAGEKGGLDLQCRLDLRA